MTAVLTTIKYELYHGDARLAWMFQMVPVEIDERDGSGLIPLPPTGAIIDFNGTRGWVTACEQQGAEFIVRCVC